MNTGEAYRLVAERLRRCEAAGYDSFAARVGQPPEREELELNFEPIAMETRVFWANADRNAIRIFVTAYGPSTWRIERVEESIVLKPPSRGGTEIPE